MLQIGRPLQYSSARINRQQVVLCAALGGRGFKHRTIADRPICSGTTLRSCRRPTYRVVVVFVARGNSLALSFKDTVNSRSTPVLQLTESGLARINLRARAAS